jgi:pimeloyl-ACP methyl ester carboxylesterase
MDEERYRQAEQALWAAQQLQPSERRVRLGRAAVTVRVQEVGEGPPVVFVHGSPNSGSTWVPMLGPLTAFRCILVDRPGTGLSDAYERGTITTASMPGLADEFLSDLLDAAELERAHVVASSFGGYLALRSVAAHPERVDRMVQMGAPAFLPGMQVPAFMRLLTLGAMRRVVNALPPNPRAARMMLKQTGHKASVEAGRIPEVLLDWSLALQRDTDTMRNETAMIGELGSFRGFGRDLTITDDTCKAVAAPTLFIWGDNDVFGGLDAARDLVARLPEATLEVFPDSGHLPWIDDPERAGRLTAKFLGESTTNP